MAQDGNSRRLKAILDAFDIPLAVVAKTCGISPTYVSRVLSPNDQLTGNDQFWIRVEQSLGKLVESRRGRVFDVRAAPVHVVEAMNKAE